MTSVSKGRILPDGAVHLLIDSTGLKLFGAGEWLQEKHGAKARRTWRKLHLAVDADTGMIMASTLTGNDLGDPSQVVPLLDQVEATIGSVTADGAYDAQYGKDRHGDELPAELQRRESRLKKIGEAKATMEQEAKEKAAQERAEVEQKLAERAEEEQRTGKKVGGRKPELPDPEQAKPEDTAQRNFTDPESRIMPDGANKGSFVQGYNAQIAVDSTSQVIVAAEVTQETNDKKQLLPMLALIAANLEQTPEKVSADAGYFSEANVTDQSVKEVDLYVATGRIKHGEVIEPTSEPPSPGASPKEVMREKLRTEAGRAVYKMRKAIVEPVFGRIKEQRGFRRFSLRGKENVSREWKLVCAVNNLLKLLRAGGVPEMA